MEAGESCRFGHLQGRRLSSGIPQKAKAFPALEKLKGKLGVQGSVYGWNRGEKTLATFQLGRSKKNKSTSET